MSVNLALAERELAEHGLRRYVERIARERELTIKDVAGACGIAGSAFYRLLAGKIAPQRKTVERLATYLELPTDLVMQFVPGKSDTPGKSDKPAALSIPQPKREEATSATERVRLTVLSNGAVRLKLDTEVKLDLALKILNIMQGNTP